MILKEMEKHLTVAIQGIRGSYHHVAVEKYFGREADFVECVNFKHVPQAIEQGRADYGIMAIENCWACTGKKSSAKSMCR